MVNKKEVPKGKFRLYVHVWITNDRNELKIRMHIALYSKGVVN